MQELTMDEIDGVSGGISLVELWHDVEIGMTSATGGYAGAEIGAEIGVVGARSEQSSVRVSALGSGI